MTQRTRAASPQHISTRKNLHLYCTSVKHAMSHLCRHKSLWNFPKNGKFLPWHDHRSRIFSPTTTASMKQALLACVLLCTYIAITAAAYSHRIQRSPHKFVPHDANSEHGISIPNSILVPPSRRLFRNGNSIPMTGGFLTLGAYFVNVQVGSPARTFNVLVCLCVCVCLRVRMQSMQCVCVWCGVWCACMSVRCVRHNTRSLLIWLCRLTLEVAT